jgi:NADH:ubiquinone oxidoreductase subunit 5 (subunit L)/multisubunit Na+/H+ antiporter MnhA subunit
MEAPLGASALMHSSTLVIAGLVLIFKLNILLEMSDIAQLIMYLFGILTALYGALFAYLQYELKVIMACSTISNMGYMFILGSLHQYNDMLIVIIVHAYIKIFLFLMVGAIMLNCNGCQDIRYFGLLFSYSSQVFIFFMVGGFCLAGIPYLSGYAYKFASLKSLHDSADIIKGGGYIIVFSFYLTINYVFRVLYLMFSTTKNGHVHIYKLKVNSLFYLTLITILCFVIYYNASFWVNISYNDITLLFENCIAKLMATQTYKLIELAFELHFL